MQNIQRFSERLAELMFYANDVTSYKLGELTGMDSSTIRLWRTGHRFPKLSYAIRLADFFGCTLDFLFGRSDEEKPDFVLQPVPPFYISLKFVLSKCGKSWYRVYTDTKIAKSNIQDWREGREPIMPTLITIADYLGITLDYLVGRDRAEG